MRLARNRSNMVVSPNRERLSGTKLAWFDGHLYRDVSLRADEPHNCELVWCGKISNEHPRHQSMAWEEPSPMQVTREEYVTVDEAAKLLKVASSTIRRWIREGNLSAYRIGKRRVAIRRADLATLITPVQLGADHVGTRASEEEIEIRRFGPEDFERGLAAMERAQELSRQILAERGGKLFSPPSWVLLNESRDERTRQLSERS
jgi:excisionase family DNA binding protein